MVIWLVQPNKPKAETTSSAYTTGAANAGAAIAGAASAGASSAGLASKQIPNPVVVCASALPVSEPEPGGGVRFRTAGLRTRTRRWCALPHRRSPNPNPAVECAPATAGLPPACFLFMQCSCSGSLPLPASCGGGGASLGGDLCKSALRVSGCSLAGSKLNSSSPTHTGLGPVFPADAASRGCPPKMPAAPSVQPALS